MILPSSRGLAARTSSSTYSATSSRTRDGGPVTPARRSERQRGYFDRCRPGTDHFDLLGCGVGEVDRAAAGMRAAVVDADHDAAAVIEVLHPGIAAEGQGAVGGGEGVHVERLAA